MDLINSLALLQNIDSLIAGFFVSVYNRIIEKQPLIPIFVFLGGLIIRYALVEIFPTILVTRNWISLIFSIVLFLIILVIGWNFKKGKWKVWEYR